MRWILTTFSCLLIFVSGPASAAGPYKCGDTLSYSKCKNLSQSRRNLTFARVESSEFSLDGSQTGRWRGYVVGSGSVRLRLDFFYEGERIRSKYIGTLNLNIHDKPTLFTYKTSLPKMRNWSWRVVPVSL